MTTLQAGVRVPANDAVENQQCKNDNCTSNQETQYQRQDDVSLAEVFLSCRNTKYIHKHTHTYTNKVLDDFHCFLLGMRSSGTFPGLLRIVVASNFFILENFNKNKINNNSHSNRMFP